MTTLREVLRITYSNLQILQEREAGYGGNAPLELLNQIEHHRQAIDLLEQALAGQLTEPQLESLKAELRPLLIASNVEEIQLNAVRLEKPPLPFEPETVPIPAGPFLMGCDDGQPEAAPCHTVDLPEYRLGRFPVTNSQYAEFIARTSYPALPRKTGWQTRMPPPDRLDHPVTGISWHDAVAYCAWLATSTGRAYRLPTEAEWEKAAAWDGQQARPFPWGAAFDAERCNSVAAGLEDTSPVTRYSPGGDSFYGCTDMLGNVQEWTSTLWGAEVDASAYPYPYRPADGREAANPNLYRTFRIHRGGSYRDAADRLRCSARGWSDPDSKIRWRGFRVALTP